MKISLFTNRQWAILILSCLVGIFWAWTYRAGIPRETEPSDKMNLAYLPVFLKGARASDEMLLYEGLQPAFFDEELFEMEKRKGTRLIGGEHFYQQPLPLPAEDRAALHALLATEPLFVAWAGGKLCGGFHPDYAIEWRHRGNSYYALICFGCDEAKLIGASGRIHCDIPKGTREVLERTLRKLRVNRPEW